MLSHQAFVLVLSRIIQIFDRAVVISDKVCVDDVNIVSVAFLVSEEYSITHYKLKDCLNVLRQNEEATSNRYQCHQYDNDFGFLWIAGSVILVLPQSQNITGGKIPGLERKAFTRQNYPNSKVLDSKLPL